MHLYKPVQNHKISFCAQADNYIKSLTSSIQEKPQDFFVC